LIAASGNSSAIEIPAATVSQTDAINHHFEPLSRSTAPPGRRRLR
jgi:hypothetical protein